MQRPAEFRRRCGHAHRRHEVAPARRRSDRHPVYPRGDAPPHERAAARAALKEFLLPLELATYDLKAALAYGELRAMLEAKGRTIGPLDMLIAAHALSLGATLVSNKEFRRVHGLPPGELGLSAVSILPRETRRAADYGSRRPV